MDLLTVSSTATFEFDIGAICLQAYRDAGLVSIHQGLTETQSSAARDLLQRIVNGSQAKGLFARVVEFYTVTLVTGTWAYTFPTNILDVLGDAMFIQAGMSVTAPPSTSATNETVVQMVQRDRWNGISNKSATGRPTMYYPHRTASHVEARIWPVPSTTENAASIRFQTHRFRADVRTATATVDYERYWTDYLILALGSGLARQHSLMDRYGMLKREAEEKLEECKAYSKQRGPQRVTLGHRTAWGNR